MRLQITVEAAYDLAAIHEFCLERSEAWADKVQARLVERARSLLLTPDIGRPMRLSSVRKLSVADIQYVIDYEVADDLVRILRVQRTREIR